jgi:hypothetical protein
MLNVAFYFLFIVMLSVVMLIVVALHANAIYFSPCLISTEMARSLPLE